MAAPNSEPKKVEIRKKDGQKLVGLFHDTASLEIVVLCHGVRSSKEFRLMVNLAVALENEGISAFRFDFSGNGESDGPFRMSKGEAEDLRAVIEHFSSQNRVVSVILGHSKGATSVLLYASKYHDVPLVINVCGRYDLKRGIAQMLGDGYLQTLKDQGYIDAEYVHKHGRVTIRVTEDEVMERLNTDLHSVCLGIDKSCRVLTVHGTADDIVPVEDAYELAKILPKHELCTIDGADHAFTEHTSAFVSVVIDFINRNLEKNKAVST